MNLHILMPQYVEFDVMGRQLRTRHVVCHFNAQTYVLGWFVDNPLQPRVMWYADLGYNFLRDLPQSEGCP